MNKTVLSRLEKKIGKSKDLEGAIVALNEVVALQEKDPEANELWELRLESMRQVGSFLPPKHTHRNAAESALDRRQAYKCRLLAGVAKGKFDKALKDWRKEGKRPRVQSMLRWARKDRGEDPQLLMTKAERAIQDLRDALSGTQDNGKAFASIERGLKQLELAPKKGKTGAKKKTVAKAKTAAKKKTAKKKPAAKAKTAAKKTTAKKKTAAKKKTTKKKARK